MRRRPKPWDGDKVEKNEAVHEASEVPHRPQQCSSGGMTHPASMQR